VVTCSVAVLTDITDFGFIREPRKIVLLGIPDPLRGCNSDLAQYSNTPSLQYSDGGAEFVDRPEDGFVVPKGLQDSARGFNPGNTSKKCPALKGRKIGVIDS